MTQATDRSKAPDAAAKVRWLAGMVALSTGVALFAQDLSPHDSDQDGAHPVAATPAVHPGGVEGTAQIPAPANRENEGESLADGGRTAGEPDNEALPFRRAAEQGDAIAQFNLGVMYHTGSGVPKDDQKAVLWYRKAAEQGHAGAQSNLGVMYDVGSGVPKDDRQAALWYRKAAEQGLARAQFNLGLMYADGEGVPEDDREAVQWYRPPISREALLPRPPIDAVHGLGRAQRLLPPCAPGSGRTASAILLVVAPGRLAHERQSGPGCHRRAQGFLRGTRGGSRCRSAS